jgi:hypothetical protein
MPKIHSVYDFESDFPTATPEHMKQHEQLMRDPANQAEMLEAVNEVAKRQAARAGLTDAFSITATLHQLTHHA